MNEQYHQTIRDLETQGVARDYILGWASGFLGTPKIEEQRITECYAAGYEDGRNKNTDNADNWKG
ncbi:MAG: Alvin_2107 family globule sulfur oxidation protein [bacterium]